MSPRASLPFGKTRCRVLNAIGAAVGCAQPGIGSIRAARAEPPLKTTRIQDGIGHVLLNSATDKPWPQYFCCTVAGNYEFVRKFPVATKRAGV